MTTLEELQSLDDATFHKLADTLLRRLELRYRNLRPHGVNDQAQSIRGQPDSYVGDTASTARIAFCYTTQKNSWWTKVLDDIRTAVKSCPTAEEVVVALPSDVDREGPTKKKKKNGGKKAAQEKENWLDSAKAAAGKATFTIYDGRLISKYLDEDHQDIRLEFLGIPYSRLTAQAVLSGCRKANKQAIDDLTAKGRYAPECYVFRASDLEFRRIWMHAWTFGMEHATAHQARLIPLVNDSGVGKTSLLCAFAEATDSSVPVLLIQARDCSFDTEDALARMVMQKIQGVLEPSLRATEEAAITRILRSSFRLTVILDGLDESRSPSNASLAIKFWLESNIGSHCTLVVSSRPEFWRRCAEATWERWIPQIKDIKSTAAPVDGQSDPPENRILGYPLPGIFTPAELQAAWEKAGLDPDILQRLPQDLRRDLRHPFTFRACSDILKNKGLAGLPKSRGELVAAWLSVRLHQEVDIAEGISLEVYWKALRETARCIEEGGGTVVEIDKLASVPRFDATHPPGPVVERLIRANILEVVQGRPDTVRFVFDTVFELFVAEADAAAIRSDGESALNSILEKSFSSTLTRLSRLGHLIAGTAEGDGLLEKLARKDYAKALAMMQSRPASFSPQVQAIVYAAVAQAFDQATRPEQAFIMERLGYVDTPESRALIETLVLTRETCPSGLHRIAAHAIGMLSIEPGIPALASCGWFGYPYYHRELLSLIRGASPSFRVALSQHAAVLLQARSGTGQHAIGTSILAYVGDERLVTHLGERLALNGLLEGYENHALLALGTNRAGELFANSARSTASAIAAARGSDSTGAKSAELFYTISPRSADLRYLISVELERHILGLIDDQDDNVSHIGVDIAVSSRAPTLLRHIVLTGKYKARFSIGRDFSESITTEEWLSWWKSATSDDVRETLLNITNSIPDVRVEDCAIERLEKAPLSGTAAYCLARNGTNRCLPHLREALKRVLKDPNAATGAAFGIVFALGELHDINAVALIDSAVRNDGFHARSFALDALAKIGTPEAEKALLALASEIDTKAGPPEDLILAMVALGSRKCIERVLEFAKGQPNGPEWLLGQVSHVFMIRGHTVGQYYRHVEDRELITYLFSAEGGLSADQKWKLIHSVEQIDSESARGMLRDLASRAGTDRDAIIRDDKLTVSQLAHDELMHRGDDFSVPYFIRALLECSQQQLIYHIEQIAHFRDVALIAEVAQRLKDPPAHPEQLARLLALLGQFGTAEHTILITPHIKNGEERVRNVAYEAVTRLTDPLRLAQGWQEIHMG